LPLSKQADDGGEAPLVVLCDDVGGTGSPSRLSEVGARLDAALPGTAVHVVPGACSVPGALAELLSRLSPARVVLGCARATRNRAALLATLRRAGVSAAGSGIVELQAAADGAEVVVVEQSVVLLRAALARVATGDIDTAVVERTSFELGALSRRSLMRGLELARRPVATWRADHCPGGPACTACLASCPAGALVRAGTGVHVDAERCSGCGACVVACRNGSFALPGADVEASAAAAGILVAAVGQGVASGVALTCQDSARGPCLGQEWLALPVPSLEMVTAGWLLQLLAAGAGVRLVACAKLRCRERASSLEAFLYGLALELRSAAELSLAPVEAGGAVCIEFREPEATTRVLSRLGALGPGRTGWRVTGTGCPLGSVSIDSAACSLCEVCVAVCPTGALAAERDERGSLQLSFEPGRCSGCGACVTACPERVVSLEAVLDGGALAAGRRIVAVASEKTTNCDICGTPLFVQLSAPALARVGSSHPFLGTGATRICADCRLRGRTAPPAQAREPSTSSIHE